jgi:major membrane immunogen (membrane-anchored lipoprotein)
MIYMFKKFVFGLGVALALVCLLASCEKCAYKDGVYTRKSSPDDKGAWGEVTVTITDGQVSGCQFITRKKDGTIKGEDYGKVNGEISNRDFYGKAQLSVRAMSQYAAAYRETGDLDKKLTVYPGQLSPLTNSPKRWKPH